MSYSDALARIHEAGFNRIAKAAAPHVVGPRVVDLGCGGGTLAKELLDRGLQVTGFDLSPEMIKMAREKAPAGQFHVADVYEVEIPDCDSVTAIGEIVNYQFVPRNLEKLFRKVAAALPAGGQFLFDASGPGRAGGGTMQVGEYVVKAWTETDRMVLTRHMEVTGPESFAEEHKLRLLNEEFVQELLVDAGFAVELWPSYGENAWSGWTVYSCKKQ